MRKRIVDAAGADRRPPEPEWLDLEHLAQVEITSEDPAHPIESALSARAAGTGWRAAQPREQTVRVLFDRPQAVRRIRLLFEEPERSRTQEFVLRWSADGRSFREVVRQQYSFSPPSTTREMETYDVDLAGVTALELSIVPDTGGGDARASLAQWRVA